MMIMTFRLPLPLLLLMMVALLSGPTIDVALAQGAPALGACGPVYAAGEKRITTPHHIYTTQTQDGTTRTGEIIAMMDAQYILVQGAWMRSPLSMSAQEALQDHRERFRSATAYSCQKLRTESINGVAAVVYQMHSETDEGISDGQLWIATQTGLPIKQEVDLNVLIGLPGKSHTSARFEYVNVQTPTVVQEPR
jgi:hypothetical protein